VGETYAIEGGGPRLPGEGRVGLELLFSERMQLVELRTYPIVRLPIRCGNIWGQMLGFGPLLTRGDGGGTLGKDKTEKFMVFGVFSYSFSD